jgi:hypothetical protein
MKRKTNESTQRGILLYYIFSCFNLIINKYFFKINLIIDIFIFKYNLKIHQLSTTLLKFVPIMRLDSHQWCTPIMCLCTGIDFEM